MRFSDFTPLRGRAPAPKKHTLGFSLIELLLVLGVLAILLTAAFVVYPKVRDDSLTGRVVNNSVATAANVTHLFHHSYSGLTNTTAINARLVPERMVLDRSSSALASEWGGNVTVSSAGLNNKGWRMVYEDVPSSICTQMATRLSAHFTSVAINGQVIKDSSSPTADPGVVALACEEANVVALGMGSLTGAELMAGAGSGSGTDVGIPGGGGGGVDTGIPGGETGGPTIPGGGGPDEGIPGGGSGPSIPIGGIGP